MDKVKINLGHLAYDKLVYDAETFDFFHNDGSVNLNAFLNLVISNMYDFRKDILTKRRNFLQDKLSSKFNPSQVDELVSSLSSFDYVPKHITEEYKSTYISLRPNKETKPLLESIALVECKEMSLSSFIFSLLEEYLHLDQSEREIITNMKESNMVYDAINNNQLIAFNNGIDRKVILRPYLFGSNQDNSFNYVYGITEEVGGRLYSTHLYKLRNNLTIIDKHFSFTKEEKERMNAGLSLEGIQYAGSSSIRARVLLDEVGLKRIKKIYYNRPFIESIETDEKKKGGIVTLLGAEYQIQSYIYRLEEHAFILEPLNMSKKLRESHKRAYISYDKRLNALEKKEQ